MKKPKETEPAADRSKGTGWAWPYGSRKAHFYVDGRSLCGKWVIIGGTFENGNMASPDNCAGCRRKHRERYL